MTNEASTQTVDASGNRIESALKDSQRVLQAATALSSLIGSSLSDALPSYLSTVQNYSGRIGPLLVEALQTRGKLRLLLHISIVLIKLHKQQHLLAEVSASLLWKEALAISLRTSELSFQSQDAKSHVV